MLNHIFKLVWQRKRSNFLMMLEIAVSFLILFGIWTLVINRYKQNTIPVGLDTKNVWVIYFEFGAYDPDTLRQFKDMIYPVFRNYPEIESYGFTSYQVPFGSGSNTSDIEYGKKTVMGDSWRSGPEYPKILGLKLLEGRWFTYADTVGNIRPVVLSKKMRYELFGNEEAIGKQASNRIKVVGVVEDFKIKSDYTEPQNFWAEPDIIWDSNILLKVKSDISPDFEAKLSRDLLKIIKNGNVSIKYLDTFRVARNKEVWTPILIGIVAGIFLILNVIMGLFGVLFQNINSRRAEIGIRRAMGATKGDILSHFLSETVVIASFGVMWGIFFAIQFPLLKVFDMKTDVYMLAIVLSLISIYSLVILCAFFPSRQAAKIYPAIALHES